MRMDTLAQQRARRPALVACLTFAGLCGIGDSAYAQSDSATTAFMNAFVKFYERPGMPGCAVGILQRGELTALRTYGLASVENGTPITADTRFDIASMSKQFTAMAILMLAEQGKLALNDDVRKYVPELPTYSSPVTLRHMLHHTSGLKDWDQLLTVAGWRKGDVRSSSDVFWVITHQRSLNFAPGTRYSYSNTNYVLLGLVVERITGKPLEDFLQKNIFEPLGMKNTTLNVDRNAIIPQRAWPYNVVNGVASRFLNSAESRGDGGIYTTVGDLALWELNLVAPKVGSAAIIAQMEQAEPLADGSPNNYAMGLFVYSHRGQRMLEHNGAEYGYHSEKLTFPDAALSVILLCNRRDTNVRGLAEHIADRFLPNALPAATSSGATVPTTLQPANWRDLVGPYWSARLGDGFFVTAEHDMLMVDSRVPLRPIGATNFSSATGTYEFTLGSASQPAHVAVTDFDQDVVGRPQTVLYQRMAPPDTDAQALQQYAGEYVNVDLATSWCLFVDANTLMVRRRGFPDEKTQPMFKDAIGTQVGVATFSRKGGKIDGFTLSDPRLISVNFDKLVRGQQPVQPALSCPEGTSR